MSPLPAKLTRPSKVSKPPRKRNRVVISCTECHRRKQKCDRSFPCSNCVIRNKQSICRYEGETPSKPLQEESANTSSDDGSSVQPVPLESHSAAQVRSFGYAKSSGNSGTTLAIFNKIEDQGVNTESLASSLKGSGPEYNGLREKYKSLIRQLPSKFYIEKLVATFFNTVNCEYYSLDEGIFRDHLQDWHSLSFSTLNKGPQELSGDLQFFPALLCQVLALAVQFQPPDYDPSLDSLKYAAAMSFDDLASDYSESGVAILSLLGKRNTTLITVQAGFLRTSYLKNCGMVIDSWHSLSQTIRDAQEIGLQKTNTDNRPRKPEEVLDNLWQEQLRRRMWLILSLWDIQMALVLGRPTTLDCRDGKPPFPLDAPIPKNRRAVAPLPRTESDPPTPLTMLIWKAEMAAPLWDIVNLEKEDPNQYDFAKVERMHKLITKIPLHCPAFFRSENPDTTFDSHPDCTWLAKARPLFQTGISFTIMALHRPYIFINPNCRTCALEAGLDVLRAQREFFNKLEPKYYKMFKLVLNTFDAIVLMAAIYILYPQDNLDRLDDSLQHFEWAMERFHMMSGKNAMAKPALGVLEAIYARLKKALNQNMVTPRRPAPSETITNPTTTTVSPSEQTSDTRFSPSRHYSSQNSPAPSSLATNVNNSAGVDYPQFAISKLTAPSPGTLSAWNNFSGPTPTINTLNFDFSSIAPLQPLNDLLFNDLSTFPDPQFQQMDRIVDPTEKFGTGAESTVFQFEGGFATDSFWGFMNSYNP